MRNLVSLQKNLFKKSVSGLILFSLGLSLTLLQKTPSSAQSNPVPQELQTVITQIQTAANQQDVKKVMEFYSPQFTSSDGLTYANLQQTLTDFWQEYDNIQYNTRVESWTQQGDKTIAETVTTIQGTSKSSGRTINLTSTITSKQHFQNQKLVYQEIVSEKRKLPPAIIPLK